MKIHKLFYFVVVTFLMVSCGNKQKEAKVSNKLSNQAISVDVIVPEHGMADPHAWVENGRVYIICGHDESWDATSSFPMDRWELWSSEDLVNWEFHRNLLPQDTYIGDKPNCWAGDICERDGKYYWFFSNRNIDTGVMVADSITGEYKDLLGKPLLPKGIVPVHPYDPEIYIEDDVYTICFGVGTYYMATLSKDMKSLDTEPKEIIIQDKEGNKLRAEDKPTLFKRNDLYYLVYGSRYSISKNLYGPYEFQGAFLDGGHTSFFDWKGQKYVMQENHDISAFYRGASLKPVNFNEDGSIIIPKDDRMYPAPGRPFEFKNSTMGWKALSGTDLSFKDGKLVGNLSEKNALIRSAPWLYTDTRLCSEVIFNIKNNSNAKELKFSIYTRNEKEDGFWAVGTDPVDWSQQQWITIPISSNDTDFKTYKVQLSEFKNIENRLMQIALQPASDSNSGSWELDEIIIK
ncbi:family 43 glycosylhydrolase [Polaribacter sp. Z014]|uniref:family 43 glycosylhydrolase n=1 Tax=Polaribacter sp. Z014 TaxID=2927126 RepID=UPI002021157B|nr:family 43 glycosylhydrolase [Polaribacter sp. Z014]MCL7764534.1 family 43 glycosylhydrolase [Polaribacter sp. Z014]